MVSVNPVNPNYQNNRNWAIANKNKGRHATLCAIGSTVIGCAKTCTETGSLANKVLDVGQKGLDAFRNLEQIKFLQEKSWAKSNFWFYTIKVHPEDKKPLMVYLLSKNIQVRPIWKLIHTLPMYKDCQAYALDKAIAAHGCCVNLPCSVGLKSGEIEFVVENVKEYFNVK